MLIIDKKKARATQYHPHFSPYLPICLRKVGDSNPRYGNPYVSLANWWFQPLTQPSLLLSSVAKLALSSKASAKVIHFFESNKIFTSFLFQAALKHQNKTK